MTVGKPDQPISLPGYRTVTFDPPYISGGETYMGMDQDGTVYIYEAGELVRVVYPDGHPARRTIEEMDKTYPGWRKSL